LKAYNRNKLHLGRYNFINYLKLPVHEFINDIFDSRPLKCLIGEVVKPHCLILEIEYFLVKRESDESVTKIFLDFVPPYYQVLIPLSSGFWISFFFLVLIKFGACMFDAFVGGAGA
jgi:hypothetical protein